MKAFKALFLTAAMTVTLLGVTTHAEAKPTLKKQAVVAHKHGVWKTRKHIKRKHHVRKHHRHVRRVARHHMHHH